MASELPPLLLTTAGTVSACRFVKSDPTTSAHAVSQCSAGTDSPIGISLGQGATGAVISVSAPETTTWLLAGSGGWTYGQLLMSDANGAGIPHTPGNVAAAYATGSVTEGNIGRVVILPSSLYWVPGSQGLPPITGKSYYTWVNNAVITQTGFQASGTCSVTAYYVNKPLTVNQIGSEVTTPGPSGSVARYGVYADNGNSYPGALLADAGTAGATATGNAIATLGTPLNLTPGLYWFAFVQQVGASAEYRSPYGPGWPMTNMMMPTSPGAHECDMAYFSTGVTAALPTTFPATVQTLTVMPRLFIQVA